MERLRFLESTGLAEGVKLARFGRSDARNMDVVIIATDVAHPDVVQLALDLAADGGSILVYAGTKPGDGAPGLDVDLDRVRRSEQRRTVWSAGRRVTLVGSHGIDDSDFLHAIRILSEPTAPRLERLVSREIGLSDLPALLRESTSGRGAPLGKVLVHPQDS
jgi:hypothetical protein